MSCVTHSNKWIRQLLFLGSNELRSRTLCFAWILWDLGLSTHTTKCHSILRSGIFSQILALVCCWPHTQWRQTDSQLVRCEGREWGVVEGCRVSERHLRELDSGYSSDTEEGILNFNRLTHNAYLIEFKAKCFDLWLYWLFLTISLLPAPPRPASHVWCEGGPPCNTLTTLPASIIHSTQRHLNSYISINIFRCSFCFLTLKQFLLNKKLKKN